MCQRASPPTLWPPKGANSKYCSWWLLPDPGLPVHHCLLWKSLYCHRYHQAGRETAMLLEFAVPLDLYLWGCSCGNGNRELLDRNGKCNMIPWTTNRNTKLPMQEWKQGARTEMGRWCQRSQNWTRWQQMQKYQFLSQFFWWCASAMWLNGWPKLQSPFPHRDSPCIETGR